jgi:NTE family protein
LQIIVERGHRIRRIVAASSGALNGVALAAGIRDGRAPSAMAELTELWRTQGGFRHVVHPTFRGLFHLDGLSDAKGLHQLLADNVRPATSLTRTAISLVMVVGRLEGRTDDSLGVPMTTFEQPITFADADFDSAESLETVFRAATASATFPALFAPVPLPGLGPCIDGGVVNNTPIHYAVDAEHPPDAVLIICALPAILPAVPDDLGGSALFTRLMDALINERLYRDLVTAEAINRGLGRLDALPLSNSERAAVLEAIGWVDRRSVRFVPIRPDQELAGSPFDAFFSEELRTEYLASGKAAAIRALAEAELD